MHPDDIWDHIEINGSMECWPWTMGIHHSGYGVVNLPNKKQGRRNWQVRIHRLVWELTFGEIPEGLCVLHKCDNPPCCNPNHLFIGTYKDNYWDMVKKGRRGKCGYKPGKFVGEKATAAKLTNKEVLEIKRLLNKSRLTHSEIASRFDCNRVTITQINLGIIWNSVKLEDLDIG